MEQAANLAKIKEEEGNPAEVAASSSNTNPNIDDDVDVVDDSMEMDYDQKVEQTDKAQEEDVKKV
jgi:hypothetical protein